MTTSKPPTWLAALDNLVEQAKFQRTTQSTTFHSRRAGWTKQAVNERIEQVMDRLERAVDERMKQRESG
jgi:hypothetical protein